MDITSLELLTKDLVAQRDFYSHVLELPVDLSVEKLEVQVGATLLVFNQAAPDFDGAYHFAFNIPGNKFGEAKEWISSRLPLLHDETGKDEFASESWNSDSVYFKDAAGNVLEFIARHRLKNATETEFGGRQILNVSEIGLPSEDVIAFAMELCSTMEVSVFQQEPGPVFTPIGDDHGLLILPIKDRIWFPNSGMPARLLPVRVNVNVGGRDWEVRGVPYEIVSK